MTEWEFLNEVVEAADCGILLDVNNIYVSSQNHTFNPFDYVNSVPAERVAQIHIAGHSKFEKYILDTHDHPVLDPVWGLYQRTIERVGHTATLLEWDDNIPTFDEVHGEALKANQYLEPTETASQPRRAEGPRGDPLMTLLELQRRMSEDVMRPLSADFQMQTTTDDGRSTAAIAEGYIKPNDRLSSFDRLEIYNRQYWFRVITAVAEDFPALNAVLGSEALMSWFWRTFGKTLRPLLRSVTLGPGCPNGFGITPNLRRATTTWRWTSRGWSGPMWKRSIERRFLL